MFRITPHLITLPISCSYPEVKEGDSVRLGQLIAVGAKNVYACCSHALLSGDALSKIENSAIVELVCTDSIKLSDEKKACKKIVQLPIAPLIGQGIMNIIDDKPVSGLFNYERKEK